MDASGETRTASTADHPRGGVLVEEPLPLPAGWHQLQLDYSATHADEQTSGKLRLYRGPQRILSVGLASPIAEGRERLVPGTRSRAAISFWVPDSQTDPPLALEVELWGHGTLAVHGYRVVHSRSLFFTWLALVSIYAAGLCVLLRGWRRGEVLWVGLSALVLVWLPSQHLLLAGSSVELRWDRVAGPFLALVPLARLWEARDEWSEAGLGSARFWPALRFLALPCSAVMLVLLVGGAIAGTLAPFDAVLVRLITVLRPLEESRALIAVAIVLGALLVFGGFALSRRGPAWGWPLLLLVPLLPVGALVQQLVIQGYFHRELLRARGPGWGTVGILTVGFALIHLPNPVLTLGVLVAVPIWVRCHQRAPNLYALAISHHLMRAALNVALPASLLPNRSVGVRFLEKLGIAVWGA